MRVIGYICARRDEEDARERERVLQEYARQQNLQIDEIVRDSLLTDKENRKRQMDALLEFLDAGDLLLVADLSCLGLNMLGVIQIINQLSEKGAEIVFVRQPELSTRGPHKEQLLAIYNYLAEAEREFISIRTKEGLAAARAKGKKLGRPKGSRDKQRVLDPYREQIREYLELQIPLRRIHTIINPQLEKPLSYNSYQYFVRQDTELLALWRVQIDS